MSRIVGFNYAVLPDDARKPAQTHAQAIKGMIQRNTESTIEIGRRLLTVKQLVGRHFNAWLRAEFHWAQSMASNYMRIAAKFGELDCVDCFQQSALYLLARESTEPETIEVAIERARTGEIITKKEALKIIDNSQPGAMPTPDVVAKLERYVQRLADQLGPTFVADQLMALAAALRGGTVPPENHVNVRTPEHVREPRQPAWNGPTPSDLPPSRKTRAHRPAETAESGATGNPAIPLGASARRAQPARA